MPYSMCPICGAVGHLNVGADIAGWYAQYYPGLAIGELVPEPCPWCPPEIVVGDLIITRRLTNDTLTIEAKQRGTVEAIRANAEFGKLFVVKLESGKILTCPRSALRKRPAGEG